MQDALDAQMRAVRATRELAHVATSLASEAANLARAFEPAGALEDSIAASHASIRAARAAFEADETARTHPGALDDLLLHADQALDAAQAAVDAARRAVGQARGATRLLQGDGGAGLG